MKLITKDVYWNELGPKNPMGFTKSPLPQLFDPADIKAKLVLAVGEENIGVGSRLRQFSPLIKRKEISSLVRTFIRTDMDDLVVGTNTLRLPYDNDEFDSVFAIDVITNLGERSLQVMKEMKRVARETVVFNVSHTDLMKRNVVWLKWRGGTYEVLEDGRTSVLYEQGSVDRAYFNMNGIIKCLVGMGLLPHTVKDLTANEVNNLDVHPLARIDDPDYEFKEMIYVKALKRS